MKKFSIILALDNENGIGKDWDLAWNIPEDMKYFKNTTIKTQNPKKQNVVIMGRKTWESIPEKYRPFKNRRNCILSRGYKNGTINSDGAYEFSDFDSCLREVSQMNDVEEIFIIGGSQLYNEVLTHRYFETAYITRIYSKFHCDVFFNWLPYGKFTQTYRSDLKTYKDIEYEFLIYKRKRGIIEKIKDLINI